MLTPLGFFGGGGVSGAFELISTTLLSSNTSSVTFSSNGAWAGYKHLQLRLTARNNASGSNSLLGIRFNNDSTTSYSSNELTSNASTVTAANSSANYGFLGITNAANGWPVISYNTFICDISEINNTSKNTTFRSVFGFVDNPGYLQRHGFTSGVWPSTSAVTSLTIIDVNGASLYSGARLSLYGIKG